jgi:hypothetical protein
MKTQKFILLVNQITTLLLLHLRVHVCTSLSFKTKQSFDDPTCFLHIAEEVRKRKGKESLAQLLIRSLARPQDSDSSCLYCPRYMTDC